MKPIIKWTGGKRREIVRYLKYIQTDFKIYVEPFFGGGATFWFLEPNNAIINDLDQKLIEFYRNIDFRHIGILATISNISDRDSLQTLYYECREKLNKKYNKLSVDDKVICFAVVNQTSFSGMRRFNKSGHFNVPFGHYKKFSINLTKAHIRLMKETEILNGDGISLIKKYDKNNTLIFIDPPYTRTFTKYSGKGDFGQEEQIKLNSVLKSLKKAKYVLIIDKSDLTTSLYSDMIVEEYKLKYGVNIKNRFNTSVSHLIVSNIEHEEFVVY